jgi:hypothetical protein
MKRGLIGGILLGILTASTATAQDVRITAGYGRILPTADYSRRFEKGWQLMGAVEVTVPRTPLGLRVDGMYGGTGFRDDGFTVGSFHFSVATAAVVCHIGSPAAPLRPYLLGGIGYSTSQPEWAPAFAGGGGLSLAAGPWKAFVEGRFVRAGNVGITTTPITFVAVTGGLSFGL